MALRRKTTKVEAPRPTVVSSLCTWLPLTLRWPFLLALFVTSLALGIVTITVSLYSAKNSGLCNNNGSATFFFAWRFLPILLAVIYALLVTVLTNDVKGTEPFAKLSTPEGSSATSTLLLLEGPWWNDPFKALSRRNNNGRRSWTLSASQWPTSWPSC